MTTLAYVSAACAAAVTLIAAFRGWRSIAIWFFTAGMVLLAAESVFTGLAAKSVFTVLSTEASVKEEAARWQAWRSVAMTFLPAVWLLFSLSYARGNYRQFFNKWRYAIAAAGGLAVLAAVAAPAGLLLTPMDLNKENFQWIFGLRPAGFVLYTLFLISAVMVMMNLERTFRAAVGTMRWHIKFMILGLGVLFAVRACTASLVLLSGRTNPALDSVDCGALLLGCLLMLRSLFRDVSEVAVFPSKALLENSLTALVSGIYFVLIGVSIKLVPVVNAASFQAKAFVLLALLVATTVVALSDRVRMHTRRFLSRSFQRPFYDYRSVWRTLTEGIGSRVNQQDFCQAAVTLVSDIFQVLAVTMWLVDDQREDLLFAASTSLSSAAGDSLRPQKEEALAIIQALHSQSDPIDIETSGQQWTAALRRLNPTGFRTGGRRVCVPLRASGHGLGIIVLGDRVGGILFSLQDFDLLRCVGDQIAAGLLNAELSQKLLQAKELEAFQTMSAFFIHDLKNTASTLNLMLQNLPVHFDNPEFRQDTLRGVAKTSDHINHLIGRLSLLRHDLQIKPVESDLNDVVARVLSNWSAVNGVTVVKDLRSCPRLLLDPEQIFKVVTNLMLNAAEALADGGQIRVESAPRNGWAVLTVADNGCGMAPEFVSRALFRPFQTTKKKGFGIGMFQSKMIVEAHGGRIEVESELQKGTVFKVLLPLQKLPA